MEYYGTLGPSCQDPETLKKMLAAGMTGLRLNLSHGSLPDQAPLIAAWNKAQEEAGVQAELLIDLEGPELRTGVLTHPVSLAQGSEILLGQAGIPVPDFLIPWLLPGQEILIDDGKLLLKVIRPGRTSVTCQVLRGGLLTSRKSLALQSPPGLPPSAPSHRSETAPAGISASAVSGEAVCTAPSSPAALGLSSALSAPFCKAGSAVLPRLPALTENDKKNLSLASSFGVTGVMLPFVRGREDLGELKKALSDTGAGNIRIFAKLENTEGLRRLPELFADADVIVIARGDLGSSLPLWELPRAQKEAAARCRKAGVPFLVVTQLLDSMQDRPVPTRAEVLDIFNAVLDGASALMLTGETAVGHYPAEAMEYLVRTAEEAVRYQGQAVPEQTR